MVWEASHLLLHRGTCKEIVGHTHPSIRLPHRHSSLELIRSTAHRSSELVHGRLLLLSILLLLLLAKDVLELEHGVVVGGAEGFLVDGGRVEVETEVLLLWLRLGLVLLGWSR